MQLFFQKNLKSADIPYNRIIIHNKKLTERKIMQ